ncbi:MAG: barren protein [Linnemannia elongata]|nr:MAG: barren protein [Linnemannia elongata]
MLGQQKSPVQQRNLDAMRRVSSGQGGSSSNNRPPLASSSSSAARYQDIEVPLGGTTELNDDAKEKRLRRMSDMNERANRRLSFRQGGPAAAAGGDGQGSGGNNLGSPSSKLRPSGPSGLLGVVDSLQAPLPIPVTVSMDSFEQWLKLATDNKINVHNSWNLALIDYFHDMSVLREGDSINFQKASCTLDGCVKVYTSRVDSVATETTKLLGGLATSAKGRQAEEVEETNEDDDDEQGKPAKKKHSSRGGNTLAKDFSSLSLEKFNLEFSVDPLFKKTSADFDEGGARGLLLNHLSIDAEGKIIFDAGDARDEGDDDDDEDEEEEEDEPHTPTDGEEPQARTNKKNSDVESAMIDIQKLRSKFLPSLNQIFSKDICPSLKDFQLSGSSELDFSFLKRLHGDGDGDTTGHGPDRDDIFGGDDDDDGYDDDFGSPPDVYDDLDQDQVMDFGQNNAEAGGDAQVEDAFGDLDAQIAARQSGPTVERLMADSTEEIGKDPTDMYAYLDSAFLRNWAGPEHWKLRRPRKEKKPDPNTVPEEGAPEDEEAAPKKKGGKAPLVINFLEAAEVDENELFAPADASALSISNTNLADSRKQTHLLPDDIHFSSKQLLRMFLKPAFIMKSKNKKPQPGFLQQNEDPEPFALTFPDEEFWASHTNNVNDGDMTALTDQLDQTQIYNDYDEDDDDFGSPDQGFFAGPGGEGLGAILGFGLDGDGNDYASQLVTQPKLVKASSISFSKTAKKVDVKKLKDNIWKEMTQQSLKRQAGGRDDHDRRKNKRANIEDDEDEGGRNNENDERGGHSADEDEEGDSEYVKKEQRFTEIIGGLSKMYPEQKLRDISVPFCFICLLHLANEKDLEITGSENLNELVIRHN